MKADEQRHAEHAENLGARKLPSPIPKLMALSSRIMKAVAYRL
jgi:ubiquinone biosynthesis monooxygenase Coq7